MSASVQEKVKKWANPTDLNGDFVKELHRFVTLKAEGHKYPSDFASEFQKKIIDLLGSAAPGSDADANKCEAMFNKLRKDPVPSGEIPT